MEHTRIVIPLLVAGVLASLVLVFDRGDKDVEQVDAIPVRVASISGQPPMESILIAGTTESAETALLRFQVGGRVLDKKVSLGDKINKGDVLATVYNPELDPIKKLASDNFERAKTQAQQLQRDFDRVAELFRNQAVTRQEWERSRTSLESAQNTQAAALAELERAQQVSAETQLTAPFSGRVTEILIDKGEVVSPGSPAIRVSDPSAVELSLPVSDAIIAQLSLGQMVLVSQALDPNGGSISGVITEISPFREKGSLPEVVVALNSEQIGPGRGVTAELKVKTNKGIGLPLQSVIMTGERTVAVYQVVDDKAVLIPVRPVRITTDSVVIESGIVAGSQLVVEGLAQLYDGAPVEVQK